MRVSPAGLIRRMIESQPPGMQNFNAGELPPSDPETVIWKFQFLPGYLTCLECVITCSIIQLFFQIILFF